MKLTDEEKGILGIVRLNKLFPTEEIRKEADLGYATVEFSWRSKKNLWGRFGGGWNWELGFQIGGRTLILNCLVFAIVITRKGRKL